MHHTKQDNKQKEVSEHILHTLLYYDIFNYPLKEDEVFRFLGTNHLDMNSIRQQLKQLTQKQLVYQFGEFFTVQNNEAIVTRRRAGNIAAKKFLSLAKKKARLIAAFPFVRAVMASGSLSKDYMDENSDLDFFIITEPGRLWIARVLLVMYKRIFLFNSHKYFCVNYFVDSQHLEIEEKNLFTATELATVIPLYGAEYYQKLCESNCWLKRIFPNHKPRTTEHVPYAENSLLKKVLEQFINLIFADRLNRFFKSITLRRWERLYQRDYRVADFQVAFKSKDYASKNHPRNLQRKVMDLYEEKLKQFSFTTLV